MFFLDFVDFTITNKSGSGEVLNTFTLLAIVIPFFIKYVLPFIFLIILINISTKLSKILKFINKDI